MVGNNIKRNRLFKGGICFGFIYVDIYYNFLDWIGSGFKY